MRTETLEIDDIIDRIARLNTGIGEFWSDACGWAPRDAANLLSRSRLDWQVSLSQSLRIWTRPPKPEELDAWQILGYANLGALLEGSLKLFLSVWYTTYRDDVIAITKHNVLQDPDEVSLAPLRLFFKKRIWSNAPSDNWDPWIHRIQRRRNSIHAFKDRDIGTHAELLEDIRIYLRFLRRINGHLPYPEGGGGPMETTGDQPELFDDDAPFIEVLIDLPPE